VDIPSRRPSDMVLPARRQPLTDWQLVEAHLKIDALILARPGRPFAVNDAIILRSGSAEVHWESPTLEIKDIAVEDKGKFRLEGLVSVREKSLGGAIRLGVAREYLEWLPQAEEVFSNEGRGYLWTTVHLSGTIEKPEQDLSPRIIEALKESPGDFLALVFRLFGEWLKSTLGGE
jgi:hypothetical protein